MAHQRIWNWFDNAGANTNLQNYQFNLGDVNKLHRIEVTGAVIYPTQSITDTTEIVDPIIWGVQYMAHGATPLTLPADSDDVHFLAVEAHTPDEVAIGWAPNTATAAAVVGGPIRIHWGGQFYIGGGNTDICFTATYSFTAALTWVTQGGIGVDFT